MPIILSILFQVFFSRGDCCWLLDLFTTKTVCNRSSKVMTSDFLCPKTPRTYKVIASFFFSERNAYYSYSPEIIQDKN